MLERLREAVPRPNRAGQKTHRVWKLFLETRELSFVSAPDPPDGEERSEESRGCCEEDLAEEEHRRREGYEAEDAHDDEKVPR